MTMAVEKLHPDVGSVIELGGQDAKIIMFKKNEETGDKTAQTSMNDKCASGTGATIDKCVLKVGMPREEVPGLKFDPTKLHHVAAKCGVFAETDIVNLVKSGIPRNEIMNSLADAIVSQNLAVLTRGNTLKSKVLLLGGPNTYLPFLQECWRLRIPEAWAERGYEYDKTVPIEELIFVPKNSDLYAAYGAVLFGLYEPEHVGAYRGLEPLDEFINHGRKSKLGESRRPGPRRAARAARRVHREVQGRPHYEDAKLEAGKHYRGVIGLDGGSTSSKCVFIDENENILKKVYTLSKGNPIQDMKDMFAQMQPVGDGSGRHARGHRLRRHGLRRRRAREVARRRREHRRDRRAHDEREALVPRRRRHLRHRRAGHQGDVHAERRREELPPVEQLLGRQRHAAAGDGRPVRHPGQAVRRGRVRGAPRAEVQLRLRRVPRLRPRELPEGGLREGGAARGPRARAAEEHLAVRRPDPAHGRARPRVRAPGRHAEEPRRAQGAGRLHREARPERRGLPPPALRRGRRDRRRVRGAARDAPPRHDDVRRPRSGDRHRVRLDQQRGDALQLLPEQLLAHVHRHQDPRRQDRSLHLRASRARRAPSRTWTR